MQFKELSEYFRKIEETSSRIAITELLSELFTALDPAELEKVAYLLQGRVVPLYEKKEFGMAEKMIIKAVVSSFQMDRSAFIKENNDTGDIGKTVEALKSLYPSFEQKDFSIEEVFEKLMSMATASGVGSQDFKVSMLATLVRQLDPISCRYIVRIPSGTMRLGFSDMTILDGYSWMLVGNKSFRKEIEKAYHVRPDLGFIGRQLKEKGIEGLKDIKPTIKTPIIMMRAERLSSGEEIVKKIGVSAIEPKYDGFRIQAHYQKDSDIKLYTRGLEEVSDVYPDIVEGLRAELKCQSAIVEGEAIGYDVNTNSFLPFQETVQRKRKHDIDKKAREIPLKFFVFELLYLEGVSYVEEEFSQRRSKLEELIDKENLAEKNTILLSNHEIIGDAKKIELNFDEAISKGLEGIVAKKLKGVYQAGARGWNWIKLKRSYSSKINDTIDCVVMGYDYGKGKRADFGIGAFLVGVYEKDRNIYKTVAKIGTGLTDEEWRELKTKCDSMRSEKIPAVYDIDKTMDVDVYVNPEIVVEVRADEISRSPIHTAGRKMKPSKSGAGLEVDVAGFALRFPRLERFRDDKRPDDVTETSELEAIFSGQYKGF